MMMSFYAMQRPPKVAFGSPKHFFPEASSHDFLTSDYWLTNIGYWSSFILNSFMLKTSIFFSIHCEQNFELADLKSVNMIRWVAWTMGQINRRPTVWCSNYYFFSWFLAKFFAKKSFHFIFSFFYEITKIKIKSFKCPKSIKSIKKNTWNIRLLVDDSFVPSSKQLSNNIL